MLKRMHNRLSRSLSYANVMSTLAVFGVLAGGTAYAANTVFSTDIVDGEVKSVDVGNNEIGSSDVKDNSLNTFDVHSFIGEDVVDGTLTGADVANTSSLGPSDIFEESLQFNNYLDSDDIGEQSVGANEVINNSLLSSDLSTASVGSDEVAYKSLTNLDIDESTLNLPPTTTAAFAGRGYLDLNSDGSLTKVLAKNLPAGSYGILATANLATYFFSTSDSVRSARCELRNGGSFIGDALDRRRIPGGDQVQRSLSLNGGAQVPAGGGEVSLWCSGQSGSDYLHGAQMMILKLDGFF